MPDSNTPEECSKREGRHPLEYFIAVFLVLTFIATGTAAYYTRQQWLTSQDTEIRQLRAYVFATDGIIYNFETDKPVVGAITFKNSGQTPAYNFEIRTAIAAGPYLLREDLPWPNIIAARTVLGPGVQQSVSAALVRALTAEEATLIKQGTAAIYVYGEIDFTDAFEVHRCAKFRYFFGGEKGTQSPSGPLNTYRNGNEEGC